MFGIKHHVNNKEFLLVFNGTAMFELQGVDINDMFQKPEMIYTIYSILAREGELVRRYYGYDRSDILSESDFKLITSPSELPLMASAVMEAYLVGMRSEIDTKNQKIDVTTLELDRLEKKTG